MSQLIQVITPYFCAAAEADEHGVIRVAAPILRWSVGKQVAFLRAWTAKKGYRFSLIEEPKTKDVK